MATTKLAFYSNSDLNTSSATGFSGFAVHDGSNPFWQLGGGALDPTPTTTLKVVGTGEFTGQVTIPQTPINPTDAASKAYVDLQSGGGGGGVTEITTTAPITGGPITTAGSIGISQASTSGDGYISSANWNTFNNKQSTSEKGAASGYAPLDANQKVPSANLPDSLVGAVVYQSTWNAGTDTPTLPTPAAGNNGHYYIVSDPGTYLGITYAVGDWIISNGIAWEKVDNTQDVNSVFGRQGNVVANANDYAAFYDANVQSNWNETNSGSDAFILNKPTIPPAYTNADVDAHLNTDTATASQVLSWTGSDYDWVAQSGGGGGVTSIIAGTGISILPGNGLGDVQITNTLALQSAYDTSSFFSGSGGVDSLASLFNGNASDKRILLPYPDTDKLWVVLDLIAYLDTSGGTYTADGDLYVGPDVTIPSEGIGIKIPSTFLNSTTSKVIGIRCAMDYEVAENDIKGKDFVLKAFSTPVSISSTGATLKISYTRRLLTNLFD
jgi:hypothetical protein